MFSTFLECSQMSGDTGTLDWFLTNRPAIFQLFQLPKIARSDYFTILAKPITSSIHSHAIQKVTVRDLRESAWRTFERWLTYKDWSQLSSAESCKHKFHIFIFVTELQNAVGTYLPGNQLEFIQLIDLEQRRESRNYS